MSSATPQPTAAGGVYLLDSSVLIRSLRGDTTITTRIAAATTVYVSSIVLGELYFGAHNSPIRSQDAIREIAEVERTVAVLPIDATTSQIYGRTKRDMRARGYTLPDNDLWIAATAMQYDVTLAARDVHFDWIVGLRIEQW